MTAVGKNDTREAVFGKDLGDVHGSNHGVRLVWNRRKDDIVREQTLDNKNILVARLGNRQATEGVNGDRVEGVNGRVRSEWISVAELMARRLGLLADEAGSNSSLDVLSQTRKPVKALQTLKGAMETQVARGRNRVHQVKDRIAKRGGENGAGTITKDVVVDRKGCRQRRLGDLLLAERVVLLSRGDVRDEKRTNHGETA